MLSALCFRKNRVSPCRWDLRLSLGVPNEPERQCHLPYQVIAIQSLKAHLGEEKLKKFINFVLHYVADLDIPIKRGTFIEFRNGMLNVSPIGRNCSQEERDAFEVYDKEAGVR